MWIVCAFIFLPRSNEENIIAQNRNGGGKGTKQNKQQKNWLHKHNIQWFLAFVGKWHNRKYFFILLFPIDLCTLCVYVCQRIWFNSMYVIVPWTCEFMASRIFINGTIWIFSFAVCVCVCVWLTKYLPHERYKTKCSSMMGVRRSSIM